MNAWYAVAWISMLTIPIDLGIANNPHAAMWVRLIFTGLFLTNGFIALWLFRRHGRAKQRGI